MKKTVGLLLTISIIAASFAAIFVKWTESPSTVSSMYRMYLASVLMLPMVWMKRKDLMSMAKRDLLVLCFAGVFLALHFALWFESLKLTTVASSTIILALQPIVALFGDVLIFNQSTNVSTLIAIGISIIGVVMVGWGDLGLGSQSAIIGDVLSLLCVVALAVYLFIGQGNMRRMSHWLYSFFVFLFAGMALNIYNLLAGIPMSGYDRREWGVFLLLAVFPTLAYIIYNYLLNFVNSTTVSMSLLGEPVGASILATLLLDERIDGMRLAGGFIVLLGVFFFLIQQKKITVTGED